MIIWMSGELQADVGEAYRIISRELERVINAPLKGIDYSVGQIVKWALIPIILSPRTERSTGYAEVRKYHRKRRVIEFRLKIDHAPFKAADDLGKRRMIFAMILRSVEEARSMKLPPFDFDRFYHDLSEIGAKYGWL